MPPMEKAVVWKSFASKSALAPRVLRTASVECVERAVASVCAIRAE